MSGLPTRGVLRRRALGVAVGLLVDRALGEPPTRVHPVVGFARVMAVVERRTYGDELGRGAAYAGTGVAVGLLAGAVLDGTARRVGGRHLPDPVWVAVALAAAGRLLRQTGDTVGAPLAVGDLDGARSAVSALVGRDPSTLDASGVAAAAVESLAENTVDAVVAPAVWGLLLGAPGALAHRAVNTMDAMVGHRSPRYARYGTAAARLDDAAAWVPARLTAVLVAAVRPRRALAVRRLVARDAAAHPSPNAGVAETAAAAALDLELGGPLTYGRGAGRRTEQRPTLGDGARPQPLDVARARVLVDHVELALVGLLLVVAATAPREKVAP